MRTRSAPSVSDEPILDAAARICRAVTTLAARARAERAGVLTLTETAVLGRLWAVGELTPRELADRLRLQPQSLTRTLASLESAGLLHRTRDPNDGRQYLLSVTAPGALALRDEIRPRDRWLGGVIEQELSAAERDILVVAAGLMERLAVVEASPAVREAPPATPERVVGGVMVGPSLLTEPRFRVRPEERS
jgi:DNA-binding MarR family transcriptional regulator